MGKESRHDKFRPFGRLPAWQFWLCSTRATLIALPRVLLLVELNVGTDWTGSRLEQLALQVLEGTRQDTG